MCMYVQYHFPEAIEFSNGGYGRGVRTTRDNKTAAGLFFTAAVRGHQLHLMTQNDAVERYALAMLPTPPDVPLEKDQPFALTASDQFLDTEIKRFHIQHGNYSAKQIDASDDVVISIMMGSYWLRTHHNQALVARNRVEHARTMYPY